MIVFVIALAWAALAAAAVLALGQRITVTRRARAMKVSGPIAEAPRRRVAHHRHVTVVASVLGAPRRRQRARRADEAVTAELPVAVDLVGVAVGAGCSPFHAVEIAARWSPPRVARALGAIGRATALGASFDVALRDAGDGTPALRRLTETLRTSARLGAPAAASLARLAQEVRADVRRRAEARARTVPVRLLFPLVFCVLPAFALLTVVPVLLDGVSF